MTEQQQIVALAKSLEESSEVLLAACQMVHDMSERMKFLEGQVAFLEARMDAKR